MRKPIKRKRGRPRPKYRKVSMQAKIFGLGVGDEECFISANADRTMKDVQCVIARKRDRLRAELYGKKFICRRWLMIREGEHPRFAVIVTREK